MKVGFVSLGCSKNLIDTEIAIGHFKNNNYEIENNPEKAEIIVINTCGFIASAKEEAINTILEMAEYKKSNCKYLVAMGCLVKRYKEELEKSIPEVDLWLSIDEYKNFWEKIAELVNESSEKSDYMSYRNRVIATGEQMAYLKIAEGCDNFCSYCIIPYVRGSVRSKDFDKVIKEAKELAKHGHKEIVLTGIHTGHYLNNGYDLTDLINELSKIDDIKRIRISSIEVTELNDKFLDMLKNNDKVCDHLHIPLQAGSDEILKRMNRKYDLAYYEEKIKKIRSIRPDISISTDIIVGFPYETEELFLNTLEFSKKIKFSKIHVFPYSVRVGTAAANMEEQVDEVVKKERVKRLMAVSHMLEVDYFNKFKDKELDILIETCDNNVSEGHTSNYLLVSVPENIKVGEIVRRKI